MIAGIFFMFGAVIGAGIATYVWWGAVAEQMALVRRREQTIIELMQEDEDERYGRNDNYGGTV